MTKTILILGGSMGGLGVAHGYDPMAPLALTTVTNHALP
jgi:hypothetical protein